MPDLFFYVRDAPRQQEPHVLAAKLAELLQLPVEAVTWVDANEVQLLELDNEGVKQKLMAQIAPARSKKRQASGDEKYPIFPLPGEISHRCF